MCRRFRFSRADKLAEGFDIAPIEDLQPRYNIAPTQIGRFGKRIIRAVQSQRISPEKGDSA
jgi:putative SOS response-associated peptidase YedK